MRRIGDRKVCSARAQSGQLLLHLQPDGMAGVHVLLREIGDARGIGRLAAARDDQGNIAERLDGIRLSECLGDLTELASARPAVMKTAFLATLRICIGDPAARTNIRPVVSNGRLSVYHRDSCSWAHSKPSRTPFAAQPETTWRPWSGAPGRCNVWCRHQASNPGPTDYKSTLQSRNNAVSGAIPLEICHDMTS